jgi:hypothetical protein
MRGVGALVDIRQPADGSRRMVRRQPTPARSVSAARAGRLKGRKHFFFEKKKQKTFATGPIPSG